MKELLIILTLTISNFAWSNSGCTVSKNGEKVDILTISEETPFWDDYEGEIDNIEFKVSQWSEDELTVSIKDRSKNTAANSTGKIVYSTNDISYKLDCLKSNN